MTIETKYNIDQEVWIKYDRGVCHMRTNGIVVGYNISCHKLFKRKDTYTVEVQTSKGGSLSLDVDVKCVFSTKEELLKCL